MNEKKHWHFLSLVSVLCVMSYGYRVTYYWSNDDLTRALFSFAVMFGFIYVFFHSLSKSKK